MTNIPTNSDIFKSIEKLAPKSKAYDWDNVGLQIGSDDQKTSKVMITLDVLESVVDEAIEKNVTLIIAHHPLLFTPLKRIDIDTPIGRIISKLIRHDISVYAAHTNLDVVKSGVNDMLAERLELHHSKTLIKLGNEASNCDNMELIGETWGLGKIGEISSSTSLKEYVSFVKEKLNVTNVRVVGDLNKKIKKVAIVGGSGEKYISDAKRNGADVYITGDMSFHPAQVAWQTGLAIIDAGHYIEEIMKEKVQEYLQKELVAYDVEIIISKVKTDPFQYL